MSARILIVDDEEIVLRSCVRILSDGDHVVDSVQDGWAALRKLDEAHYDIVILDIMMPKIDGMKVLQHVKETHPDVDVIMVTGLSQVQTAVKSMKLGAFDYLPKPFDPDELKEIVNRALEKRRLLQENHKPQGENGASCRFEGIIGASAPLREVFRLIEKCAPTNSNVLITGESGTGKEMIARAIHRNSLRRDQPFVVVDCNTLSEHLLESELFGHVKGSFTGAVANKRGMFDIANNGTLFLDEFGNIPLSIQGKLLRFIQEREFRAVGGTKTQTADVRLITATNRDLKTLVAEGAFREDLFYRINVFPIHSPALRERRDDIPALAFHFLKFYCRELDRPASDISDGAMSLLLNHDWPGNVRELENTMHRAVILASGQVIRQADLVSILDASPRLDLEIPRTGEDLKKVKKIAREKSVEEVEKLFVLETLKRNASNVTKSAEETGMQRANFQALMRKYNIRVRDTGSNSGDPDSD
ncbi:MAG: sigma-54 dependent transcriptional regulator [Rhodocyclaceae bacterium]|nr:sigma-54 dependent transcriptional regulator [Rhodocyclaceae bacterium]